LSLLAAAILTPWALAGAQDAAQQEPQEKEEPSYEFFSGNVAEYQSGKLTVMRVIDGKPPEKKTFLLKPDTRIEGKLKSKSRVTVGYISGEEGDVALRVVVRSKPIR
jgi:hypothetical protein